MKTKLKRTVAAFAGAAVMSLSLLFGGCTKIKIADYPAAKTSFKYLKDDSVPYSSKETAPVNPLRGFRGEAYITLGAGEGYPGSGTDAYETLESALSRVTPDDAVLMQIYVYLIKYCNTDIPSSAFRELKAYLEYLDSLGIRVLLRFAYESDENGKSGPRTKNVLSHIDQIKGFFEENSALVNRVIYAIQLGFIGLWGEGHTSVHNLNERKIVEKVFSSFPEQFFIMVRTPEYLSMVPEEYESRAGLHDDYLVGYSHEWGMMDWTDENYPKLLNKCKYSVNDGEMPWGNASPDGVDPYGIIRQAAGYGLTSLSIEHNYIEDGNSYLLKQWQQLYLDEAKLAELSVPYNPNLLENGKISVFDYLKHHLGYQYSVSCLSAENGKARFLLTNYGLAAAHGFTLNVYSDGEKVYSEALDGFNIFSEKFIEVPYSGGKLETEIISRASEPAYLYNDIPRENGRNILIEG